MQVCHSAWRPFKCLKIPFSSFSTIRTLHLHRGTTRPWTSNHLRDTFIQYFEQKGHKLVPSSPVLPKNDPSLLFVNAGMNQFKPIFLAGSAHPSDSLLLPDGSNLLSLDKAVNSQKCIRLSGKHNDFDEVGKNHRHHTFFEMLGNWAFNEAYFKQEACAMAWDLLLNVFELDQNRLLITYFGGDAQTGLAEDEQTRRIWLDLGVPNERIIPLGPSENFWEMGSHGPCGVCTEIHFILDERHAKKFDQELIDIKFRADINERMLRRLQLSTLANSLEIWNLVFMQYNKTEQGMLEKLPSFHVDTGMGFERILSILNDRQSNYDTDLFQSLFDQIYKETRYEKNPVYSGSLTSAHDIAYRIIADHVRAIVVSVADGCTPSKTDAGFCLRKLIRRVHILLRDQFQQKNSLHLMRILADQVIESLGTAFPNLVLRREEIHKIISEEIQHFQSKLRAAKKFVKQLSIDFETSSNEKFITGLDALRLQKRFGLAPETIDRLVAARGFKVDWAEFERLVQSDHEKTLQGQMHNNVK